MRYFLGETHRYPGMPPMLQLSYWLSFLMGICTILSVAPQECPRLTMKAKIRPNAKRGVLAGGTVKIFVTLRAKDPVNRLDFKLLLPRGMTVKRTATRPRLKSYTSPEIIENLDGTTAVYWLQSDLDRF